jgi:two-component system LytT family response regulator
LTSECRHLRSRLTREPPQLQQSAVKNNGSVVFLKLDEIDWFEAADNYVTLHRGRGTRIETGSGGAHSSAIVNPDRIKELRSWFRGDYPIVLRDGTELTLTKNHRGNPESRLLPGAA